MYSFVLVLSNGHPTCCILFDNRLYCCSNSLNFNKPSIDRFIDQKNENFHRNQIKVLFYIKIFTISFTLLQILFCCHVIIVLVWLLIFQKWKTKWNYSCLHLKFIKRHTYASDKETNAPLNGLAINPDIVEVFQYCFASVYRNK